MRSRRASQRPLKQADRCVPCSKFPRQSSRLNLVRPRQAQIATSVLGGMSTLTASYLAKARGSGEPERAENKLRDLENFVREVDAAILDHGHIVSSGDREGREWDKMIQRYRDRYEQIMHADPADGGGGGPPPTRRAETRSLFLLMIMLWPRSQHGKKLGAARAQVGVGMSV